jgi:hypothetical protein
MGANIPAKFVNLIRNVRLANEADKLNPGLIWGTKDRPGIFGVKRNQSIEPVFAARVFNMFFGQRIQSRDLEAWQTHLEKAWQNDINALSMYKRIADKQGLASDSNRLQKLLDQYRLEDPRKNRIDPSKMRQFDVFQ